MLKNRERMGINLPADMAKWLRDQSERTDVPISRIIQRLVEARMKADAKEKPR